MPRRANAIERATAQITPTGEPADITPMLAAIRENKQANVIIINSFIAGNGSIIGYQSQGSTLADTARKITRSQTLTDEEKIKFLNVLYNE